jgi:CRP/FNR family transcriptional regulator, nitrogen fixation regulation protein
MLIHTAATVAGRLELSPSASIDTYDASLGFLGVPISFGRDSEIYGETEPTEYLYRVVSGAVRTYKVMTDGRRQIGGFYLAGDVFGLELGKEHTLSAEAITKTKVLAMKRRALAAMARRDQQVARRLWELTGGELERAQRHILRLIKTAQERVVSFLLEMDERIPADECVELPMSRQDIADYLGLTIETISRMLALLEREGAIELSSSRRIVLRKRAALIRMII